MHVSVKHFDEQIISIIRRRESLLWRVFIAESAGRISTVVFPLSLSLSLQLIIIILADRWVCVDVVLSVYVCVCVHNLRHLLFKLNFEKMNIG